MCHTLDLVLEDYCTHYNLKLSIISLSKQHKTSHKVCNTRWSSIFEVMVDLKNKNELKGELLGHFDIINAITSVIIKC